MLGIRVMVRGYGLMIRASAVRGGVAGSRIRVRAGLDVRVRVEASALFQFGAKVRFRARVSAAVAAISRGPFQCIKLLSAPCPRAQLEPRP